MEPLLQSMEELRLFTTRSRTVVGRGPFAPATWDAFVGHPEVKSLVRSTVRAAKIKEEPLDPILLWGPPGCGKTSLARLALSEFEGSEEILASELTRSRLTSVLRLTRGVLFVDELHTLRGPQSLAHALDGKLAAASQGIVAATTDLSGIPTPLRSRFALEAFLGPYTEDDLVRLVLQAAPRVDLELTEPAARTIAERARGTPRLALQMLRRLSNLVALGPDDGGAGDLVRLAEQAVDDLGFDDLGLKADERLYLYALFELGGETGLSNVAAVLGIGPREARLLEPELLRQGLITVGSNGRSLTTEGWELFR